MRTFILVLKWLSPIPVLVGSLHLLMGLHADVLLGARLPEQVLSDPVLDDQNRFYGVSFMAYGVLLYLCATDLREYAAVFRVLICFMFLGGVGRLVSVALHGLPTPPVIGLGVIELFFMPPLLLWHTRVLAGNSHGYG